MSNGWLNLETNVECFGIVGANRKIFVALFWKTRAKLDDLKKAKMDFPVNDFFLFARNAHKCRTFSFFDQYVD